MSEPGSEPLLDALGLPNKVVAGVIAALRERGQTVATAESLTAGLVAGVLTCVPGSSAVVRGALVVYATDLKAALADVSADVLTEHGAVHPEVARQLADGARQRCGSTWGIGLTGVAGPDPQDGVGPGTVYVGLTGPNTVVVRSEDLLAGSSIDTEDLLAGSSIDTEDLLAGSSIDTEVDCDTPLAAASARHRVRAGAVRVALELLQKHVTAVR